MKSVELLPKHLLSSVSVSVAHRLYNCTADDQGSEVEGSFVNAQLPPDVLSILVRLALTRYFHGSK